jgi:hypothetical protein
MSDERKPVWPWIVALLIGLPVLYVASFGPACALVGQGVLPRTLLDTMFAPCLDVAFDGPDPIRKMVCDWTSLCGGGQALLIEQILRATK